MLVCYMTSYDRTHMTVYIFKESFPRTHTHTHTHTHISLTHTLHSLAHTNTFHISIATDKESLAVSNLQNRDVLDHFASNEDDLELFLQFLNNPEMIFTHSQRLQKILELSEGEEPTNSDQVASGEVNMSAENLTKQDLE